MHYLYTDGGSRGNPGDAAIGIFLFDFKNELVDFKGKYIGKSTNNIAEYSALIEGMKMAKKLKVRKLTCHLDSELVVKQLNGLYKVRKSEMQNLYSQVEKLKVDFNELFFMHIRREHNKFADKAVNMVLDAYQEGNSA